MSFQAPVTIAETLEAIDQKQYLLPAIQREFVWKTGQIEQLFDSILRGYPIGSFLFWQVQADRQSDYQFYEFVREYHERDNHHNPKASLRGVHGLTAVLDGQQRLTSLYIGMKGSYAYRTKGRWWTSPDAFPTRRLYLDLLEPDDDWDGGYRYRFLTAKEVESGDGRWFPVGAVLDFDGHKGVNRYLNEHGLAGVTFASDTLFDFYEAVRVKSLVNYYLEKGQDLDKVLNIFIRVNSGGTQLSYSDLLLSVATAQWKKLDAREEITALVDQLNEVGQGFRFDRDLVLKACLVLTDLPSIVFKVTNFTAENMGIIEDQWDTIADKLKLAVSLVASFGFTAQTLTSQNSVIAIAYYLKDRELDQPFIDSGKYSDDRMAIKRWLMSALLKGTFGDQADSVMSNIRSAIADTDGPFPVNEINTRLLRISKSVRFEPEELDALLYRKYGQRDTFSVLAMLYPSLDYRNLFHQDHIHPKSSLTPKRLQTLGIEPDEAEWIAEHRDDIPNLQMLEGVPNVEKSDKPFAEWLEMVNPTAEAKAAYRDRQYIPDGISVDGREFRAFYEARRAMLLTALRSVLMTTDAEVAASSVLVEPSGDREVAGLGASGNGLDQIDRHRGEVLMQLKAAAREGQILYYGELGRSLGLDMDDQLQRHHLATLLGEISKAEVVEGRPMLSCLVVQRDGGAPGPGFYNLARDLGVVEDGEDADAFAFRQMRATWAEWSGASE